MSKFSELMQNKSIWINDATILRVEVGSTVHGVNVGGQDDLDQMGICLEPMAVAMSTQGTFEHHIYRSAAEREGRGDAPSRPGDLDLTIYSAQKWCRLAAQGNPSVLLPLFVPLDKVVSYNAHGSRLRENAEMFASKQAIHRFRGYMQAQRDRLAGLRGQRGVTRQELVDLYGYDTKYAGHVIRLGLQGVEYAKTGRLTLPMPQEQRDLIVDIRTGRHPQSFVLEAADELDAELGRQLISSPLPDHPDYDRISMWLQKSYLAFWTTEHSWHPSLK